MLNEQTFEKLYALKLPGMAEALKEQMGQPDMNDLAFEERVRHARRRPVSLPREQEDEAAFGEREAEAGRLHGGHRLPNTPGSRQVGDAQPWDL